MRMYQLKLKTLPYLLPTIVCAVAVLTVVLALPIGSAAGDPTTASDIIAMLSEEISEEIIYAKIDRDGCFPCWTNAVSITRLQEAGASDRLLLTLIGILDEPEDPLSTHDLIAMLSEGISEEIIAAKIEADGCLCDTSAESIIGLKQAGASDNFILFLIDLSAADN